MNYKKLGAYDSQSVNSNSQELSTAEKNTSCLHIRRKLILNILAGIAVILILLTIMFATTILIFENVDVQTVKPTTGRSININATTTWIQHAITVAGGREGGRRLNQLYNPDSVYVDDDDRSILIAEWENDRIVKWKYGATSGQIVAGGNRRGSRTNQLYNPSYMLVDRKDDSLIICDHGNRRIVRWSRHNSKNGQVLISNINCLRLAIDNNGDIYYSDPEQHVVRRWTKGDTFGTIVAGGNGQGNNLNQLNIPTYIFVDEDYSVYVSDSANHRIIKWLRGAKEGIIVAGGQGDGENVNQLSYPEGLFVDLSGNIYVADNGNHRIMRWLKESTDGTIILGGNGKGIESTQFDDLRDLRFDQHGNLYVIDNGNQRIQKFYINPN
ncbi:unnamed protein product [Adineta steineri]|uniref:NHL repeat containing protein n=1 Tax=Adineta steineri TaxID=433720 RepID=A0A814B8Q0_9BILA|nr:unnamed protein product [Adineta steineri]CAF3998545.1 unnamed protein product [Adineta steineri]